MENFASCQLGWNQHDHHGLWNRSRRSSLSHHYHKSLQAVQKGRRSHPPTLARQDALSHAQGRSERRGEAYFVPYVESLSDARTRLAEFFNSLLLVEDQRRDRRRGGMRRREHHKGPAIPPCNPEVAGEIPSRRGHSM